MDKAVTPLPFEIEKWLITIKAHCYCILNAGASDDPKELAEQIKRNIDEDLRPELAKLALTPPQDVAALVSELRGLAEKAPKGPWDIERQDNTEGDICYVINGADHTWIANIEENKELAAYIAAANPANITKLLDCVTSLSARNRVLEAENADMKISVIAFAGPFAAEHAKLWGLPKNHLFPTHYDILEKCGARMVDFVRADEAEIRAANLQWNGNE